ncbi:MAG: hypothetical protein GX977_09365 [Firmicutes bacterium]|nr:hypothetical protein [Bacillota bacterium]
MTRKSIALRSRGFADAVERKGPVYRLIIILPIPLAFLIALWSEPISGSLWRGGILLLLGELLRIWSAGYLSGFHLSLQESKPVTWGPYGLVRNPGSWGTFLLGLGVTVMSAWWPAYVLLICMVVIGTRYVIPVEETLLQMQFGEAYTVYRQAVPSYLPGWRNFLRWLKEGRGVREHAHRFRGREAWRAEGSTLMFLVGVIAAMVIQWLF